MISSNVKENQGESRLSPILRLKSRNIEIYPIFPNFSLKIGENPHSHWVSSASRGKVEGFDPQKSRKVKENLNIHQFLVSKVRVKFYFHPDPEKSPPSIFSCPVPSWFLWGLYPPRDISPMVIQLILQTCRKQEVMQTRRAYVIHEVALSVHNCRNLESMWDDAAVIQLLMQTCRNKKFCKFDGLLSSILWPLEFITVQTYIPCETRQLLINWYFKYLRVCRYPSTLET